VLKATTRVSLTTLGGDVKPLRYTFKKIVDLVAINDLSHPYSRIAEKSGFAP
jgi:hypothetical protein